MRLDRFVLAHVRGGSRRTASELVAAGAVRVNGRPGRKGQMIRPGDTVDLALDALAAALEPQPELPLAVLFADDALVAVDKPAGMPAVALRASDRDTLANALLGRFPELAATSPAFLETGLVHRLDTATSGVVLAARTPQAWHALREQFRQRAVEKHYLALACGTIGQAGTVRVPIAHRPRRPREMCACPEPQRARALRARAAETHYRPLRAGAGVTLLEIDIPTGVRHQIRVHLASIGHPIVGDPLYAADVGITAPRLMLHATRLRVRHPVSGQGVTIESPEPLGFHDVLRQHPPLPPGKGSG